MLKILRRLFIPAILICLLAGLGFAIYCNQGLARGKSLINDGDWSHARTALRQYIALHRDNAKARMLLAEALVKDNKLEGQSAVTEAIKQLEQIPDSSTMAADARLQEARLALLVLHQPVRAERALRRAIESDPTILDSHYLLWKVYDLTDRWDQAEPYFWQTYDLAPPGQQASLLREWYWSQFYPNTSASNQQYNRAFGILGAEETPTAVTQGKRFLVFRDAEPTAAINHAALSRWFQQQGGSRHALNLLNEAKRTLSAEEQRNPFFLSTEIALAVDLGEFEQAKSSFLKWPEPHSGYDYWKAKATVLDDIDGGLEAAVEEYRRALSVWPGPIDWRLRTKKANCLIKLRRLNEANLERQMAKDTEDLMKEEINSKILAALEDLENPTGLRMAARFYNKLGRKREADCWIQQLRRLQISGPPAEASPAATAGGY